MYKKIQIAFLISFLCLSVNAANETLQTYFNKSQINSIMEYKKSYEKIKSAKDLAITYNKADKIRETLIKSLNSYKNTESDNFDLEKYKWLNPYIPGLKLTSAAEGMGINVIYDNPTLLKKAKTTPQKSDDLFINLMLDNYGDAGDNYPTWFMMTWDYGGYTLLGKGNHIKALNKINITIKSSSEFIEGLKGLRERLFMDIRDSNNFAVPKTAVLKEINAIKQMSNLSVFEKNIINKRVKELNKNSKIFQFNCEKAECSYG